MRSYILIFGIVLTLLSCTEDAKTITFKSETLPHTFDTSIAVTFDKAEGNSENAKAINTSIEAELIKAIPNSENYKSLEKALQGFNDEYIKFKTDFEDESQPWELSIETEISYQSPQIITLAVSAYSDTGGAHGNDRIQLLNFNPKTGTLLSLSNIVNDIAALKEIAKTYFIKNLESEKRDISEFFFGEDFQLPENIGFSEDGLILLYNVYEIASYSQGYTEFVIPFEALEAYLKVN